MSIQLPLWAPQSSWLPPKIIDLPSDWNAFSRVAIDTETYDPNLKTTGISVRTGGHVVGVSLAFEDGPAFYLPIRHKGGGNMLESEVLKYLRYQSANYKGVIVGANLSYDLDWLLEEGLVFNQLKWFRDIQIADPLINELHMSYSLDNIAKRYGFAGKNEALLNEAAAAYGVKPKGGLHELHSQYVGPYAVDDARLPLQIIRQQERIIEEQDLWDIYNLESKVLPVLVKLRRRGVRIDCDKLEYIENWSLAEEAKALKEVEHLCGIKIAVGDVWKAEVMVKPLESLGIQVEYTAKGKPSIRADILDHLEHPVGKALLRARKVNKLRTTFAGSIRTHMVQGRIHCTFNQLPRDDGATDDGIKGARYGRLSCETPNLQQQPSRDEFAKMWRSIYLPEAGQLWAANDYSQQEPRMLVHFAEIVGLPRAKEAAEKYRTDPNTDNHQMMAEMAGIPRKPAKELFLGKCYGMGGPKLCGKLGLPTKTIVNRQGKHIVVAGDEGQKIIDRFDEQLPFVRMLAEKCEKTAAQRGYIKTVLGRHCHFPKDENGNYDWCHKALNRLIQGSSADQTKKAMVEADAAGFDIIIQVHDEIAFSVNNKQEGEAAADIMRNCVSLNIPSKVDVEIGPSWGESM